MALVSDVLDYIGRIYSPGSNLSNMKFKNSNLSGIPQRNSEPDNQKVLNFMRNPDWRMFLFNYEWGLEGMYPFSWG